MGERELGVRYEGAGLNVEATGVLFVTASGERVLLVTPAETNWRNTSPS